jgi:hypothetical protein
MREHPEVASPKKDSIHYFNINYFRGREWLAKHYKEIETDQKLFDPTPAYIRSPIAPEKIKKENPYARIAISMRHPMTRAFSHYWHEKKKCRFDFEFKEVLSNYDLFANWIEPSFYAKHIERYLEYFSRNQILPQLYDNMIFDPYHFLRELFSFYNINAEFIPSVINRRINVARPKENQSLRKSKIYLKKTTYRIIETIGLDNTLSKARHLWHNKNSKHLASNNIQQKNMEYLKDQPQSLLEDVLALCIPEIERLENILDIDLTYWKSLEHIL